ncbi:MAG: SET domain-containing protein-lysine N-methyltransferase [Acidobacteriaceae bacterium]|nr:SET domain-containing protein-lysine N-methyltransferase [Acidobacteriaceae bacterium]
MGLLIRSSRIHAAGCYTTSKIRKGTYIVEYTGPRLTIAEGDAIYEDQEHTFLFGLKDGKHVIDGHGTAAFINHSCDPNCETDEEKGRVWIIAARDIAPGEELTYDYNLYDGDGDAPCLCGAKTCRGSMYSEKELRKRRARGRKKKSNRKTATRRR